MSKQNVSYTGYAVILAVTIVLSYFVWPFNAVAVHINGLNGIVVAAIAGSIGARLLWTFHKAIEVLPWAKLTFTVGAVMPSWWLVSLVAPSVVTTGGPFWSVIGLVFLALFAVDYVEEVVARMTRF